MSANSPLFTTRHYKVVAEVIRNSIGVSSPALKWALAYDFANKFAEDNPRFDRKAFMEACEAVVPNANN